MHALAKSLGSEYSSEAEYVRSASTAKDQLFTAFSGP